MFEDFFALWTVLLAFLEMCTVSVVSVEVNREDKRSCYTGCLPNLRWVSLAYFE